VGHRQGQAPQLPVAPQRERAEGCHYAEIEGHSSPGAPGGEFQEGEVGELAERLREASEEGEVAFRVSGLAPGADGDGLEGDHAREGEGSSRSAGQVRWRLAREGRSRMESGRERRSLEKIVRLVRRCRRASSAGSSTAWLQYSCRSSSWQRAR